MIVPAEAPCRSLVIVRRPPLPQDGADVNALDADLRVAPLHMHIKGENISIMPAAVHHPYMASMCAGAMC